MTTAAELFMKAEVVLLDFDGPVCSVFENHPPEQASRAAVQTLVDRGIEVPQGWGSRSDPHQLLGDLAVLEGVRREDLRLADEAICSQEVEAVAGAAPTTGVPELLESLGSRRWAIVSNNCQSAISRYLQRAPFRARPEVVVGRALGEPETMKPAPILIQTGLRKLRVRPGTSLFIGDSTSDVQAGLSAGVPVIGYANKLGKADRLTAAGAQAVVNELAELLPKVMGR